MKNLNIQYHIENTPPQISIEIDGVKKNISALWLRERSLDEDHRDPTTQQRLFDPHLLDDQITLKEVKRYEEKLVLNFSDGYTGEYPLEDLSEEFITAHSEVEPKTWTCENKFEKYDWSDLGKDEVFYQALDDFLKYGFILLKNTGSDKKSIIEVASKFGIVRDTNFGRTFHVYSRPGSNDLAYSPYPLAAHTDNPYREPVPGIQLLHCLINETTGGLSTLVDSMAVCEDIRDTNLEAFNLLSEVIVRFRFVDDQNEIVGYHPIIVTKDKQVVGMHYSPRLDFTPIMDEEKTRKYQQARCLLSKKLSDPHYQLKFLLQSGELMMFDNNRVLHGRTEFDPQEGERYLMGCYIDRDIPKSHHRRLSKLLGKINYTIK